MVGGYLWAGLKGLVFTGPIPLIVLLPARWRSITDRVPDPVVVLLWSSLVVGRSPRPGRGRRTASRRRPHRTGHRGKSEHRVPERPQALGVPLPADLPQARPSAVEPPRPEPGHVLVKRLDSPRGASGAAAADRPRRSGAGPRSPAGPPPFGSRCCRCWSWDDRGPRGRESTPRSSASTAARSSVRGAARVGVVPRQRRIRPGRRRPPRRRARFRQC